MKIRSWTKKQVEAGQKNKLKMDKEQVEVGQGTS